jgi:hypothetical protein
MLRPRRNDLEKTPKGFSRADRKAFPDGVPICVVPSFSPSLCIKMIGSSRIAVPHVGYKITLGEMNRLV